jgi:hypothetical protein
MFASLRQDDVIEDPSREDGFGGVKATLDFFQSLSSTVPVLSFFLAKCTS